MPQVERLLGTVDAAIYLLDYTKLKTVEEATLFAKLKVAPQPGLGEGLQTNTDSIPCYDLCKPGNLDCTRHSAAAHPSITERRCSMRRLHDRC